MRTAADANQFEREVVDTPVDKLINDASLGSAAAEFANTKPIRTLIDEIHATQSRTAEVTHDFARTKPIATEASGRSRQLKAIGASGRRICEYEANSHQRPMGSTLCKAEPPR